MIPNEYNLKEKIFNFIRKNVSSEVYKQSLKNYSENSIVNQSINESPDKKGSVFFKTVFKNQEENIITIDTDNFNIKCSCSNFCKNYCELFATSLIHFISNFSFDYYTLFKQSVSPVDLLQKHGELPEEIFGVIIEENNLTFAVAKKKNDNHYFLKQYVDFNDFINQHENLLHHHKRFDILEKEDIFTELLINTVANHPTPVFFIRKGKRTLQPLKISENNLRIKIAVEKLNDKFSKITAYYEEQDNILRLLEGMEKRVAVLHSGDLKILPRIFDFKILDNLLENPQIILNKEFNDMVACENLLNIHFISFHREKITGFKVVDFEPEVNIYLDMENKQLKTEVLLQYGEKTINILSNERIIDNSVIFRNKIEYDISDTLGKLSSSIKNGYFLFSKENALKLLIDIFPKKFSKFNIFGEEKLTGFKIRYPTSSSGVKIFSYKEWFEIDASIDFKGKKFPLAHLLKNIKEGKRYVKLSNGEYGVIPENFYKKIEKILHEQGFRFNKKDNKIKIHKINSMDKENLLFEFSESYKVIKEIKTIKEKIRNFNKIKDPYLPEKFDKILRDYQKEGVKWLGFLREFHLNGILSDEMGLGKTVQALTHLNIIKSKKPNLVIVPTSLLYNWENEIKKFSYNMNYLILYGKDRESYYNNIEKFKIILTTYNIVRLDIEKLVNMEFNYVVLDESQYIKNPSSIISKYIKRLNSEHRLSLTGTPFENSIVDIWSQFDFLHPGLLGSLKDFKKMYSHNIDKLKKKLMPLILRRKKEDVLKELPPKTEINYFYEMNRQQKEFYDSVKAFYIEKIVSSISSQGVTGSRLLIIEGLLRLRQICCHPKLVKFEHVHYKNIKSEKFENFKKLLLTLIKKDTKTVVYSQFVQMLKIIKNWIKTLDINYEYLDGTVRNRLEKIDNFQQNANVKVFLISTKAGGLGINLTAAENVVIYDPWWNPAVENQAVDRIHRIGQDKKVFAYKLLMKNSVEEKISELKERKKILSDKLLESESFISNLTQKDIEYIFS